jgi:pyruvate formate lyase activating enzyme
VEENEYKHITGLDQKYFNKFLETAISKNKKLWLRQVVVPGINDDEKHALMLREYANHIPNVERIELLPYHSMGKSKYQQLGIKYRLEGTPDMDKERCKTLEKLLK